MIKITRDPAIGHVDEQQNASAAVLPNQSRAATSFGPQNYFRVRQVFCGTWCEEGAKLHRYMSYIGTISPAFVTLELM